MTSSAAIAFASDERMILPFHRPADIPTLAAGEPLTLRRFYETSLLPWRIRNKPATRALDRETLIAWETFTSNPDLRSFDWSTQDSTRVSLRALRTELQSFVTGHEHAAGVSMSTCNKRLRTLRMFLKRAADPIDFGILPHVPDLGRDFTGTASVWQMRATRNKSRELISADELIRLYHACEFAEWPLESQTGIPPAMLWRVAIFLIWSYGALTEDHFFGLTWDLVDFKKKLLSFQAGKTSKLQGVPLTDLIVKALQKIRSCSSQLFAGFTTIGTWSPQGWRPGIHTTWSRDILWNAHFAINRGPEEHQRASREWPDSAPNLMFHHFRKTMVTELNTYSDKAGAWVAAHYMPGVTEQFYDTPDERIRTAVEARERERLPQCFRDFFES